MRDRLVLVPHQPRQRLLLARDRLGIKPLYWTQTNGRVLFGSEIKAILASGLVTAEADERAIPELLSTRYLSGSDTLFKGIHRLLPGHLLVFERGEVTTKEYWDVPTGRHQLEVERLGERDAVD